jgi:hypothetical protein
VGSGGGAAAAIQIVDKATGVIVYAHLGTGLVQATQAVYTVPALDYDGNTMTMAYIQEWFGSAAKNSGTPVVTVRLRAQAHEGVRLPGVWNLKGIVTLMNTPYHRPFSSPVRCPAKTDIKISCQSDAASTIVSGGFEGWLE